MRHLQDQELQHVNYIQHRFLGIFLSLVDLVPLMN